MFEAAGTPSPMQEIFIARDSALRVFGQCWQHRSGQSTASPENRGWFGVWMECGNSVRHSKNSQGNHAFLQEGMQVQRTYPADEPDKYYGWIEPDFDDEAWWDINVPSSWNTAFPDLWSYEGFGWHRKTIEIPESWRGKRVIFHSDGANYRTALFVNGVKAGVHEGGYTSFAIPVHDRLRFGEANTIAVAVDNLSLISRCPTERHDWWNHGGLYRSVWLEVTDPIYIEDAAVVTDAMTEPARVHVHVEIRSEGDSNGDYNLTAHLSSPDGSPAAAVSKTFAIVNGSARVDAVLDVENASLWTPDHPNLYNLTLEIGEQTSHCLHDRWSRYVGIRSIEIDGPRLLVNGEPFIIQGVNRYENYPDTGMTPNDSGLRRDVDLIKRMGGNAVRCHYPQFSRNVRSVRSHGIILRL